MSDRIHRFAVISRQLWALLRHELRIVGIILARLREDLRAGRRASLWVCLGYAQKNLAVFLEEYREFVEDRTVDRANPKLAQLEKRVRGLHSLLPREPAYSYSVLIPVYKPDPRYFEESIRSALAQSAPEMEILVGYDGAQPDEVYAVLENLRRELPERAQLVREFRLSRDAGNPGGISRTTNALAREAKGKFLLLMDHDDWIRPDLLYRYEQALRLHAGTSAPEDLVLYCNEYKIDGSGAPLWASELRKPLEPDLPYLFVNWICHCLLVPKARWDRAGGLRAECDGAQDYDLALRLDLDGAKFRNIPFFMYAWRSHGGSTAGNARQKDYASPAGLKALTDYAARKGLDWDTEAGIKPTTYRAKPRRSGRAPGELLVVVPYRDHGEMTLAAVRSVYAQTEVRARVVAVDNGSENRSIADELRALGAEVLRLDEPFNYSRMNNWAVNRATVAAKDAHVVFMNNDVELYPGCLHEMQSWIDEPRIGSVGARLWYPDGTLQHGGVIQAHGGPRERMSWSHVDYMRPRERLGFADVIQPRPALTAACLLVRRDLFEKIGGFDEVFYPIAYSDTDLCTRIVRAGYLNLYTPYAEALHKEGKSRGTRAVEDFESSTWLHDRRHFGAAVGDADRYKFG